MIIKSESPGLSPEVVDALRTFKDYPDMRRLLCEVVSFTLIPEQIQDLRREFDKMDMDGSGEISLPALKKALLNCGRKIKESEVEEIFDAMRVRKCEDHVHWHEFVAASISSDSSRVDGRNLRLAFDRLDRDHKGYITFDNMRHLMEMGCRSASHVADEAQMEQMWADGIKGCKHNRGGSRITYSDFILLL
jgi:calcium-dependent protein kinase